MDRRVSMEKGKEKNTILMNFRFSKISFRFSKHLVKLYLDMLIRECR